MNSPKVTGFCDSGCGKLAKTWFGRTAAATCGKPECIEAQNDQYENHLKEIEDQEKNHE